MNILIKQATVVNILSPHHGKTVDILIEKGIITQIKKNIVSEKGIKIVEEAGLYVSAGWLDMQANFCDPGHEHKETLENGLKTAAKGGYTGVCVMSGTTPPLDNKAQIEYVMSRAKGNLLDVYPIGTISHNQDGKDLSEMNDMRMAGAVAFGDYKKPVKDAGLILRALQYSNDINSFIITHADDKTISAGGQMNEGVTSTRLGLKGIPALAEELMIQRNIQILEYAGGKMHFPTVSTKGSVELIKKAKAIGLRVSCGVAAHNLLLDDTELENFDTNYKVNPPLRTKEDVSALRRGLENGIIDVVVSDHCPQDVESKDLEFDLAEHGIVSLQTAFSCLVTAIPKIAPEKIGLCLSEKPRALLGLKAIVINEEEDANLTLFTLTEKTTLIAKNFASTSKNSPFIGKTLMGRVVAAINNGKCILNG